MRQKELKFIITFHTTAEAIAMEKACKEEGLAGRLIPVPRQISAGCGLAWSMPADQGKEGLLFIEKRGLHFEASGEYWI